MAAATMSVLGLYRVDETILDGLIPPDGVNADNLKTQILAECAELEILYPQPDLLKKMITIWSANERPVWEKLYRTETVVYNPIHNVDYTDGTHRESQRDISTTSEGTSTSTSSGTGVNQSNSFNSATMVDNDKTISDSSASATSGNSGTNSDAYEEDVERHISGNYGVTSTQELIKQEREIAEFCIEDYIVNSFKRRFCLLVY